MADKKKEVSEAEKAAQREAKKLQKQQRVAKSLEKKSDKSATKPTVDTTTTAVSNKVTVNTQQSPKNKQNTTPNTSQPASASKPHTPRSQLQYDDTKKLAKQSNKSVVSKTVTNKSLILFSHLPQYESNIYTITNKIQFNNYTDTTHEYIHPAVVQFGLQTATGQIKGSNSRCIAMLYAFYQFITDYITPHNTLLTRDIQAKLKPMIRYIDDCRPKSISMGNTIRWLKMKINKISATMSEQDAKQYLQQEINQYINERIIVADNVICQYTAEKIQNHDTILIYGTSTVVQRSIIEAYKQQKQFTAIVCDTRPNCYGKQVLNTLLNAGIPCEYILIHALATVIKRVNKVIIGSYAALANGTVIGTIGSALIGLYCYNNNTSLLICCETYKFHERVQSDSICYNELNDPDQLLQNTKTTALHDWRDMPHLKLLNLNYDCIPTQYITMIITELGCIPSHSVPVILREYNKLDEVIQD